jgi:hypothetical protein
VTQSPFTNPCEPINTIMSNVTGINSGPMPPENGMMKVFTIMINDTKPIWMYCATGDHCQKGMVMAINAPQEGERTLALYKAAAALQMAALVMQVELQQAVLPRLVRQALLSSRWWGPRGLRLSWLRPLPLCFRSLFFVLDHGGWGK